MGSHLQDDSGPPIPPPLSPRPAIRKFKTKYKTSHKPQASCPLVCAHTWEFREPSERSCPGGPPHGLCTASSLLWGSVLCFGGLQFGDRATLVKARLMDWLSGSLLPLLTPPPPPAPGPFPAEL